MTDDEKSRLRREQCRAAGRMVPAEKRTFFTNRELAKAAGRKGGQASRRKAKNATD